MDWTNKLKVLQKLADEKILKSHEKINLNGEILISFNYTNKCVFEKAWNELTLNARGTIYNKKTGAIVAKAFPKFFNVDQTASTKLDVLPWHTPFEITDKMDGSLGIVYPNGVDADGKIEWAVATRGSFDSLQAIKGTDILKKYDLSKLNPLTTILVEIIYPAGKIQLDYGDKEELIIIGAYHITQSPKDNKWMTYDVGRKELETLAKTMVMPITPILENGDITDLMHRKTLSAVEQESIEGWVIKFPYHNRDKFGMDGLRVKIKTDHYVSVARAQSQLGPLLIWEKLVDGTMEEFISSLPDELQEEATHIGETIMKQFTTLYSHVNLIYKKVNDLHSAKAKVLAIKSLGLSKWLETASIVMVSKGQCKSMIHKLIRPANNTFVDINDFPLKKTR
mgnify:CR=1 FL=1|tara:strand:+ start:41666 stop:42850 length:1185 start_codon:yes stop_codon:yes gene_type:complete